MEVTTRERAAYAARCNVLRSERHHRSLCMDAEEQAWQGVCAALLEAERRLRLQHEAELRGRPPREMEHYATQLHRNPHSSMPTDATAGLAFADKLAEHTRAHQPGPAHPPLEKQMGDLLLWEQENREDLQRWAAAERGEMMLIMSQILMQQLSRERSGRERVCEGVLNGATVLDWNSYPSY